MKYKIKELIEDGIKLKKIYSKESSDSNNDKKEFFNWIIKYKQVIEYVEGKDSNRYKNFSSWISSIEHVKGEYFDVLIGFLKGMDASMED